MKRSTALIGILSVSLLSNIAWGAPKTPKQKTEGEFERRNRVANSSQTQWIAKSLSEIQTIKVGMTRAQLLKVFAEEGGVSTRTWRRYAFRDCPYIKVDVRFKPFGKSPYPHAESARDRITQISKPFLEWSILD